MLTMHEDPAKITANLMAPLVLCRRTHMARQVFAEDGGYDLRFPLFREIQAAAEQESQEARKSMKASA